MSGTPEDRLRAAGHTLPPPPQPRGHYAPFCAVPLGGQTLLGISGQTCRVDGVAQSGCCRPGMDLAEPRAAARIAMLQVLSVLSQANGGTLPEQCQVLRLRGFVRGEPGFGAHTAVLDAASEVLRLAYPDQGLPARTAVGAASLPDGAWIEIEADLLLPSSGNPQGLNWPSRTDSIKRF